MNGSSRPSELPGSGKIEGIGSTPEGESSRRRAGVEISSVADRIRHCLLDNGRLSIARLRKALPQDLRWIPLGVGWLAREGKVAIESDGQTVWVVPVRLEDLIPVPSKGAVG